MKLYVLISFEMTRKSSQIINSFNAFLNIFKKSFVCLFAECESGTYGKECKGRCGHCLNSTDCFHVNGTCLNGCGPGFRGNMCTTRNIFFCLDSDY